MTINDRFNEIIKSLFNGNKRAFAQQVGVSPTVIENVVGTRKGKPSYDVLYKIIANANISPEWLMTGRGNMLREEPPAQAEKSTIIQNDPKDAEIIALLKDKIRLLEEKIASHSMGLDIARCADTLSIPGKKITHD